MTPILMSVPWLAPVDSVEPARVTNKLRKERAVLKVKDCIFDKDQGIERFLKRIAITLTFTEI